jgi:DNA-binding CsgD family transcriptional regulator
MGRDSELAQVDLFLAELNASGCALVLEGDAGIGKTTIWQEAVDRARGGGTRVLACRPAAAEAKLSFSGLADMLDTVQVPSFAALPDLQRITQTGAPLWAQAARSELGRAGARTVDPSELTATERHVAELAASGLSNQKVAERAFLTVKGVEANLTRAYRKLGIRSRGGLAVALRRDDERVA